MPIGKCMPVQKRNEVKLNRCLYILILLTAPLSLWGQLTVDDCVRMAQTNNMQMQQLELEVAMAREVQQQAFTKYFPQVGIYAIGYQSLRPMLDFGIENIDNSGLRDLLSTLYGNYGAALGMDNHISLLQHGVVAGVTAVQPLYAGGQIVAGNRLARLGVEAAELKRQVGNRETVWQVEQCYWLVVQLESKRSTIAIADSMLERIEADVQSAVDAGLAMPTDLLRVQMKRHELSSQREDLENGIRLGREALAQSIGLQTDSIGELDYESTLLQTTMETDSSIVRHEEDLLRLQVEAKRLERRMEMGKSLPQIAVGAGYGYTNLFDRHSTNGTLFVTMQIPISSWGETVHKMRGLNYAIEAAELQQRDLTEKMRLQERQLSDKLATAKNKLASAEESLRLSDENYRLAKVAYEAGLVPMSELLQAQTEWQRMHDALTDARIAYRLSVREYQLLRE